ncbi:MAG TPA: 30S ribosomal protein S17 [Candidatus Aminicenantes bacterium]|nr:30S ribosomal protein S17 [Candidatus Aminicenantes bacterium]HPT00443.1 30S ribosomal protein S17 [Candidatus Aminicenantes bacterium]
MKKVTKTGVVTSAKMDKTVVVTVYRTVKHPLYSKMIRRWKKFMADDGEGICRQGDTVIIEETRPLSRHKRWKIVKVIEKSQSIEGEEVGNVADAIDPAGR